MLPRLLRSLRRAMSVVAVAAVLFTTASVWAQADEKKTAKKDPTAEKQAKNYSLPWIATLIGLAGIAVPVGLATKRKWELPFEEEEEEEKKK